MAHLWDEGNTQIDGRVETKKQCLCLNFSHLLFRVAQNREAATARDIKEGESTGRVRGGRSACVVFFPRRKSRLLHYDWLEVAGGLKSDS